MNRTMMQAENGSSLGQPRPAQPRLGQLATRCSLVVTAVLMILTIACSSESKPDETTDDGQVHTYIVRGVIRQLPDPGDPSKQLLILHEAIPDWVNDEGYETGMPGMTMPFPPAPDVDLSSFSPGDRVRFTLRLNWETAPRLQVTRIEHLQD